MACHPSHEKERLLEQQKRDLRIDPRKIQRQHRWKLGTDPADPDADPDSGYTYLNIEWVEAGETPPDQRHLLGGGPGSGFPCERCGQETRIVAERSAKEILEQPEVGLVNAEQMRKEDWERLEGTKIVVLGCPGCGKLYQFDKQFVPRVMRPVE